VRHSGAAKAGPAILMAAKQLLWIPGSALTGSPGMTGILCASSDDVLPYLCQADVLEVLAVLGPFVNSGSRWPGTQAEHCGYLDHDRARYQGAGCVGLAPSGCGAYLPRVFYACAFGASVASRSPGRPMKSFWLSVNSTYPFSMACAAIQRSL